MPRPAPPRRVLALLACCLLSSMPPSALSSEPVPARAATWSNPLVRHRADPWVLRDETAPGPDGAYYFIATVPEYDRIELRRAPSLGALASADPVVIWRKPASGPASHHVWAPELHRIDGKWFVYFAAGRADDIWAIRMYVLECSAADPLAGPWSAPRRIATPLDTFSLDATTFVHRDARYLVWAQHDPAIGGNTSLFIALLADPATLATAPVRLSIPELPWETVGFRVNEGPAVLVRHGRVWLAYSASATDANYCLGLLAADENADLLDPASWTKSPAPVLSSSETARVFGPGHNSFTTLPDGRDVLVYHAREYRDIVGDPLDNPDRHTRAALLGWSPAGAPVFDFGP